MVASVHVGGDATAKSGAWGVHTAPRFLMHHSYAKKYVRVLYLWAPTASDTAHSMVQCCDRISRFYEKTRERAVKASAR